MGIRRMGRYVRTMLLFYSIFCFFTYFIYWFHYYLIVYLIIYFSWFYYLREKISIMTILQVIFFVFIFDCICLFSFYFVFFSFHFVLFSFLLFYFHFIFFLQEPSLTGLMRENCIMTKLKESSVGKVMRKLKAMLKMEHSSWGKEHWNFYLTFFLRMFCFVI